MDTAPSLIKSSTAFPSSAALSLRSQDYERKQHRDDHKRNNHCLDPRLHFGTARVLQASTGPSCQPASRPLHTTLQTSFT